MLMQPTIEKLYSMKLTGMAEAVRRQMEDPEASRLSFEERLALLVDPAMGLAPKQSVRPPS